MSVTVNCGRMCLADCSVISGVFLTMCLYMDSVCESRCPWRPEVLDTSEAGVTGDCELSDMGT